MEKCAHFTHFEQKNIMHNCYSNHAYMHGYCSTCIYYFISFFSLLLSISRVALTLTAADYQRMPHHASTENTTSKFFFQNQVKQEISIIQDLFGCQEKHRENKK